MPDPTISFLIPTHREDRPLRRCLDALDAQLGSADEVLVIGDTADGPLPGVKALVQSYGSRYRYMAHDAGRHTYGHDQLNYGLAQAQGNWLHCSDDDDIHAPGAISVMRSAAKDNPDHPILFRFLSYHGIVFWVTRGVFAYEQVGGHCLLTPNIPGKVGKWGERYQGDWDYISSTVELHGGEQSIVWRDEIVVIARP